MTELSPAAQAVITASNCAGSRIVQLHIAAALRAAADQVVPEKELPMHARGTSHWYKAIQRAATRSELLAIAAELRGDTTTPTETP